VDGRWSWSEGWPWWVYFAGVNVIGLLLGGGAVIMLTRNWRRLRARHGALVPLFLLQSGSIGPGPGRTPSLGRLFLEFLKLGSVTFGSGYVLFAYLNRELVGGLGWLTPRQLLDAVAVGQVTPGPVFSAATFIGYLLHGATGAVLATIGIFLPSFVLIATLGGVIAGLRRSSWAAAALDGVNAAAVGVMAGVCWDLGRTAIVDPLTAGLAAVGWVVLVWFRLNYLWLILAGAAVGVLHAVV
jgi:chromate transporter